MEQEQRPQNPYELMSEEELDALVADWHEYQRGLNREYGMMMAARTRHYMNRLGR